MNCEITPKEFYASFLKSSADGNVQGLQKLADALAAVDCSGYIVLDMHNTAYSPRYIYSVFLRHKAEGWSNEAAEYCKQKIKFAAEAALGHTNSICTGVVSHLVLATNLYKSVWVMPVNGNARIWGRDYVVTIGEPTAYHAYFAKWCRDNVRMYRLDE